MSELDQPSSYPPESPAPAPPSPPLDPPAPNEERAGGAMSIDTKIDMSVGHAEAEKITLVGKIDYVNQYFPSGDTVRPFSVEHTVEVKFELESSIADQFVHDDKVIESALADLERQRMLLLSGERNSGKATMAVYLGTRIARKREFRNPTLSVRPLDERVDIELARVAAEEKFQKRVIVFTDIFDAKNRGLLEFFAHANRIECAALSEKLRAHDAYLIFTAASADVSRFQQQIAEALTCRNVEPVPQELVKSGFDRKLAWLRKREIAGPEHVRVASEHRDRIVSHLRTMQRVSMFLDQFVASDPNVELALGHFDDVDLWFGKDLPNDVDAWCFALTLAIAQSALGKMPVGWCEFERVRRAVAEAVKSDNEIFPRRRRSESGAESATEQQTSAQLLSDDRLFARCRAEVFSGSRLGDVVSFIDPDHALAIWRRAVSHNRRVLTAIVPVLRSLAENERGGVDYAVRALAAQMLGWIGEIDPFSITVPLVQREWVGARDRGQRPFVGKLLLGARRSENPSYRRVAMTAIDTFLLDGGADDQPATDRLLTAMSVYSQIGAHELAVAMERLGEIAIRRLAPVVKDLNSVGRLNDLVNRELSRSSSRRDTEDLLYHSFRLGRLARQIWPTHVALVLALKQAIVYLCIVNEPVSVLRAMRDWIAKGGETTGTIVALLFLHGIAEELDALSAKAASLEGASAPTPIMRSLSATAESVEHLAGFLADVHTAVTRPFSLPGGLQRDLQERFSDCLTGWARNAVSHPLCTAPAERLYVSLTNVRGGALKETIYTLLGSTPFVEEAPLRTFATAVRRRKLQDAAGGTE